MKKIFITLMIAFVTISSFATETIDVSNETFPYTYSGKWEESNYCLKSPCGNNQYCYTSTFKVKLNKNDTLYVTYTGDDSYTQNIMIIGTSSVMSRSGSFISTKDSNEVLIYVSSNISADTLSLQTSYNLQLNLARAVTYGLSINGPFPYTYSGKWEESNYCLKSPCGNNQYCYTSIFKVKLNKNDTLNVIYTGDDSYTQNIMAIGTSSVMSRSGFFISTKDSNEVLVYVSSNISADTLSLQTSYNLQFNLIRAVTSGLPINMSKSSNFITTAKGSILIKNTQERATIYNIGGTKVYEGTDREIALPSGIYVVRIGTAAKKVIVK